MKLNNKIYDILKWVVIILLPAATTFYITLDKLFGWGLAEIVATVSAATCTFLGTIIGISTINYTLDKEEQDWK